MNAYKEEAGSVANKNQVALFCACRKDMADRPRDGVRSQYTFDSVAACLS